MKRSYFVFVLTAVTAMLASGNLLAVNGIASNPVSDGGVTPYIIPGANNGGNRTCAEVGVAFFGNAQYYQCWSGDRDPGDFGLGFPDISGNPDCARNVITSSNDGTYVEFSAAPDGVGAAIVKGGNNANVYVYSPQAASDSGLASPINSSGGPAALSHSDGFCWNPLPPDEEVGPLCYDDETAWSNGTRYVRRGNWATWTALAGAPKSVVLFAGQTLDAGTVQFSAPAAGKVTITIQLNAGWRFALKPVDEVNGVPVYDNNVKIQGYAGVPPTQNPAPGQFADKTFHEGQSAVVVVDQYAYYGVHVDVERVVDCPVL